MTTLLGFLKSHGDTILQAGAIVALVVALLRWVGRRSAKFINDTVLPAFSKTETALNQLTGSVQHLSERTHENTAAIEAMSTEQQRVNLEHATAIARLQGQVEE